MTESRPDCNAACVADPPRDYLANIESGLMDDEMYPFVSGVNCLTCGRFVGRDGHIGIGYFEMSSEVAYVEGECRRCLNAA